MIFLLPVFLGVLLLQYVVKYLFHLLMYESKFIASLSLASHSPYESYYAVLYLCCKIFVWTKFGSSIVFLIVEFNFISVLDLFS